MLLDDIGAFLQAEGLGTLGEDFFLSTSPDTPDTAIVVREYGGEAPVMVHNTPGVAYELPRFQVACRAVDYETARLAAERCYRALARVANQQIGGARYLSIAPLQPPFPIGPDESGREIVVFNCGVQKTLSTIV